MVSVLSRETSSPITAEPASSDRFFARKLPLSDWISQPAGKTLADSTDPRGYYQWKLSRPVGKSCERFVIVAATFIAGQRH